MHFLLTLVALIWLRVVNSAELDHFLDRPVRMFISGHNHIFVMLDVGLGRLTVRSKYTNLKNMLSTLVISRDKDGYRIKFNGSPICVDSSAGAIKKCEINTRWFLNSKVFGYTISDGRECLTALYHNTLKMAPCTASTDQVFDLKLVNPENECDFKKSEPSPPPLPLSIVSELLKNAHHSGTHEAKHHRHSRHRKEYYTDEEGTPRDVHGHKLQIVYDKPAETFKQKNGTKNIYMYADNGGVSELHDDVLYSNKLHHELDGVY